MADTLEFTTDRLTDSAKNRHIRAVVQSARRFLALLLSIDFSHSLFSPCYFPLISLFSILYSPFSISPLLLPTAPKPLPLALSPIRPLAPSSPLPFPASPRPLIPFPLLLPTAPKPLPLAHSPPRPPPALPSSSPATPTCLAKARRATAEAQGATEGLTPSSVSLSILHSPFSILHFLFPPFFPSVPDL
jgi:hypothetical protein